LTHRQAVKIRKLIIERMPDQLSMPFYLWTRESVAQLIERQYGKLLRHGSLGLNCISIILMLIVLFLSCPRSKMYRTVRANQLDSQRLRD
ncbi:hypothetical protein VSR34_37435, partial [Paraburkholderia sp. JHI2823]